MACSTHLTFNTHLGRQKPETIRNVEAACPFCRIETLTDLIDRDDSIILLLNKYQTLENTLQTVLIETDECDSELSLYPREHLHKLIRFGLKHWRLMQNSGKYKSVIFYKNHGPLSGGTIRHPHMQIVGLVDVDAASHVKAEDFVGELVTEANHVSFSISTAPRVGFVEFNIRLKTSGDVDTFAEYIQTAAHFTLHHYHSKCNSYNIFFYDFDGEVIAKVVPRFVTSPLYVGYSIPQVLDNLKFTAERIREIYYPEK